MKLRLGITTVPVLSTAEGLADDVDGEFTPGEAVRIRPGLNQVTEANVLVHESLHAMLENIPLDWEDEYEEMFVNSLTPWLQMWLVQNPELIGHILKLSQ